jgi:hypothetical protein
MQKKEVDYGNIICWLILFGYFDGFIGGMYINYFEIDLLNTGKIV